jgi:hypothetical protein
MIGRRLTILIVSILAVLHFYPPPASSPVYHIPGLATMFPPRLDL